MDAIASLITMIKGFFDWIYEFLTQGIIDLVKDGIEWLIIKLTVLYIDIKIQMLEFSWNIASTVLDSFNIGSVISSYASQLDSELAYLANTIGFFDGINMIIQATVSSFVLKLMRF